ncbi:MAG TPA: DHA2 family efflux MFS transporter permease subunit [Candidatus Limnocylindrales bacterium]|nr:DHA2 family efflux MFS transporter permease subunit [Candidatus Limnocylindrales bacterium]
MAAPRPAPDHRVLWTFAISSIALFMAALDNLVVTTALPVIRASFNANLAELEWIVNAYTLTFAVLLLTGAALGDRFGRKRLFIIGLAIFTGGSVIAALSSNVTVLIVARAVQGLGGAILTPLSLTILSAAVPRERRAVALGAWGGIAGLAIAIGPLVGGAISEGLAWQAIFWINVPIGLIAIPMAYARLSETRGPSTRLDLPGLGFVSGGLLAVVWGLVRANEQGWTSLEILGSFAVGIVLLASFVAWEARSAEPMLPLRLFRSRSFTAANVVSMLMTFGMFGSIFLLAQFFQVVQHYSPLQAGLRTLPWTIMPVFVAPIAGLLSARTGTRPLLVLGMSLQAIALGWMSFVVTPTVDYGAIVPSFILAGIGMGLFFAPIANVVLSAVRPEEEGKASGANNAIRELGGVFGVAVLASIFSANGGYASGQTYVDGLVPAMQVGAVVVAIGALAALALGGRTRVVVAAAEAYDDFVGVGAAAA